MFRFMLAALVIALPLNFVQAAAPLDELRPFLKKHCYECHGATKQENDMRFDTLGTELSETDALEAWQGILDQLNLDEMPPEKKPRPEPKELARVVRSLTDHLKQAYAKRRSTGAQTVIRRLNRFELRNTLRDLLYLKGPEYRPRGVKKLSAGGNGSVSRSGADPIRDFPEDENKHGFINIGDRLVMSDFFLNLTIGAAEETLQAATHLEEKPDTKPRRFAGHLATEKKYGRNGLHNLEVVSREFNADYDLIAQRNGYLTPTKLRKGVGTSARYRITVEASAHNQNHPWGEGLKTDEHEPFRLGLNIANTGKHGIVASTSQSLVLLSLPGDGKKHTITVETWLDKTWAPWLGWENGPYHYGLRAESLVKNYLPAAFKPRPDQKTDRKAHDAWPVDMARALMKSGYKGPHIRIYSLTVQPLIDTWPPKSHTALYGSGLIDNANIERLMLAFAGRAFRRPVEFAEIAPFVTLVHKQITAGVTKPEAMRAGYTAMLCSPRFLYIKEQGDRLDQYEIASRLSYFLWSSMPDEKLTALAKAGKLTDAAVLQQQVERMLDDPKAAAFTRDFTVAWLRLDKLGKMPPGKSGPLSFYHKHRLEPAMILQTTTYFADMVKTNGNIRKFIDSEYTYMNEALANWIYGRKDIVGKRMRKVTLNDPRRGGIFTQPSVMTATANGVDTSPVVRGVWVLENVLGTPPSPPPSDVEPLPADLRGAKTIREQLALHRKSEACNSCHRKIDPMGFAMENFDPVGRWRDEYPDADDLEAEDTDTNIKRVKDKKVKDQKAKDKIDASATTAAGRKMADIVEFKKMLMSRKQQVARCLTEKMLAYSSGRILEPTDRGEIDKIVATLEAKGNGLRDLIHLVIQSEVFLTK